MKKTILSLFTLSLLSFSYAQNNHTADDGHNHAATTTTPTTDDVLVLKETEHDFSQIPQGKPAYYSFEITNTGKTELKLDNVQATCGCTTPEWSRDAIAPGKTAIIKVGYNAANLNHFDKQVFVKFAGVDEEKVLAITGEVLAADAFDAWVKEESAKAASEKTTKSKNKGKNKSGK